MGRGKDRFKIVRGSWFRDCDGKRLSAGNDLFHERPGGWRSRFGKRLECGCVNAEHHGVARAGLSQGLDQRAEVRRPESVPSASLRQDEPVKARFYPVDKNLFRKARVSVVSLHRSRSNVPGGKLDCCLNHFVHLVLVSLHGPDPEQRC